MSAGLHADQRGLFDDAGFVRHILNRDHGVGNRRVVARHNDMLPDPFDDEVKIVIAHGQYAV